jgi:uncharacterized peroxidase-related enzyme
MAWIDTIDEADATGELRELYAEIIDSRGKLSNILKVHSLHPAAMDDHMALYETLLFGQSKLRRATREAIAVVVSAANECTYCTRHHGEALNAYWKDEARVAQLADDHAELDDLDTKDRAAFDYAATLTRSPNGTSEADVEALREAGWSDRDVLDITLITAYFNFVNRIANGLGVDVTEDEVSGYNY